MRGPSGGVVPESEIETRVAVRMGRRDVLTRPEPIELTALISEGALRQRIGTAQVTIQQLDHLAKMAQLPNIDLRVIPFSAGWHPGLDGNFLLLSADESTSVSRRNDTLEKIDEIRHEYGLRGGGSSTRRSP